MSDEPAEHELVMPFVAVRSRGGPFDDEAYVCGYEAGHLAGALDAAVNQTLPKLLTVHTANLAQVDLVLMRYGFRITECVLDGSGEWANLRVERDGQPVQ